VSRLARALRDRWAAARSEDDGNAIVEFLGITLILLVPTVYLVLTLGRIQAGTFAAESAAAQAARAIVVAGDFEEGLTAAVASTRVALDDQGFPEVDAEGALAVSCSSSPCRAPGSTVATTVTVEVPLPLIPDFVSRALPLAVRVGADHVAAVDQYGGVG